MMVMDVAEADESPSKGQQSYSMQIVLEEVATLRKRVKELEDDAASGTTVDTKTDREQELGRVRKDIAQKHEAEKAEIEMNFMSQLSEIQTGNRKQMESLQQQLRKTEAELREEKTKAASSDVSAEAASSREALERLKSSKDAEIERLQNDLSTASKELGWIQKEAGDASVKVKKLETQKAALIDEVTGLRLELGNQAKVIESITEAMTETEQHYKTQVGKLQEQTRSRDSTIGTQKDDLKKSQEKCTEYAREKNNLLEEITELRMQLEREAEKNQELAKKMKEDGDRKTQLEPKVPLCLPELATNAAENKATEMRETIEQLQKELRSMTTSYKSDVSKLEGMVAEKEAALATETKVVEEKKTLLKEQAKLNQSLRAELKGVKEKLDESTKAAADFEQERTVLASQRVAFERKLSESIEDHLSETDQLRNEMETVEKELFQVKRQLVDLEKENKSLNEELESERAKSLKLKTKLERKRSKSSGFGEDLQQKMNIVDSDSATEWDIIRKSPKAKKKKSSKSSKRSREKETPSSSPQQTLKRVVSKDGDDLPESGGSSSLVIALADQFETSNQSRGYVEEATPQDTPVSASNSFAILSDDNAKRLSDAKMAELEQALSEVKAENSNLRQKLQEQYELVGSLRVEISSLKTTREAIEAHSRREFEEQKLSDKAEIERLKKEMEGVRAELDKAEKHVEKLKKEIKSLTIDRMKYEEQAMDNYDKRVAAGQKSHHIELNRLKVDLTNAQLQKAEMEKSYQNQVKELEEAVEKLNTECDKELEEKQAEVDMIQHKYDLQLSEIDRLTREKDQLTSCMNSQTSSRKSELEDLQSELMAKTSEHTAMKRDIQKLEMQVEHHNDQTREIGRLKNRVAELQSKVHPVGTKAQMQKFELERVQAENGMLKDQLRSAALEKRAMQEKLNIEVAKNSEDRSMNVLKERNERLRREVEMLKRSLNKIQGRVTRVEF